MTATIAISSNRKLLDEFVGCIEFSPKGLSPHQKSSRNRSVTPVNDSFASQQYPFMVSLVRWRVADYRGLSLNQNCGLSLHIEKNVRKKFQGRVKNPAEPREARGFARGTRPFAGFLTLSRKIFRKMLVFCTTGVVDWATGLHLLETEAGPFFILHMLEHFVASNNFILVQF